MFNKHFIKLRIAEKFSCHRTASLYFNSIIVSLQIREIPLMPSSQPYGRQKEFSALQGIKLLKQR